MRTSDLIGLEAAKQACAYESRNYHFHLLTEGASANPILLKIPRNDPGSGRHASRLANEYQITFNLHVDGVRSAREQFLIEGRPGLVLEYFAGSTLREAFVEKHHSLAENLELAIAVASVLENVHREHVVHRNLSSSHVLVKEAPLSIRLIGFGGASCTNSEGVCPEPADLSETILGYISPEQTGRINRSVDNRADLYSLGALLYEVFSGKLPFSSDSPAELIHSHLARTPLSLDELNREIPHAVSSIVMRLLSKDADQRYQSAYGAKVDLENCLTQLRQSGRVEAFPLGASDYTRVFRLPSRLYGREGELLELKSAVIDACAGHGRALLLSGEAGSGKTALLEELRSDAIKQGACIIKGNYEGGQHRLPYAGLIQAVGEMIDFVLTESPAQLTEWKAGFLEAVEGCGSLLIGMFPHLELILGPQTPAPEFVPAEAPYRFRRLLRNFLLAMARRDRPLVLMLDNLQWADPASLELLNLLLSEIASHPILFLGAYRSEESGKQPLSEWIESIAPISQIALARLSGGAINQLISNALLLDFSFTEPLARAVSEKTGGNALFVVQFLRSLQAAKVLRFDADSRQWSWDADLLQQHEISHTIATLMAERIKELPEETSSLLAKAACIGKQFELRILARLESLPESEIEQGLRAARDAGMIQSILVLKEARTSTDDRLLLEFIQDRVWQAAYALLPRQERRLTHLRIGQLLLQRTPDELLEEHSFEIADQLNECFQHLSSPAERQQLARINLLAGRKASRAAAYQSAIWYLSMGIGLLPENRWESCGELTLNLLTAAIEANYLTANYSQAALFCAQALEHATELQTRIHAYEVQLLSFVARGQDGAALQVGWNALAELDFWLPVETAEYEAFAAELQEKVTIKITNIEDLARLPEMTDSRELAIMRILMHLAVPAQRIDRGVLKVIILEMVLLSIQYGNSPLAAFAYAWYGAFLCATFDDIDKGYRFGQLALEVLRGTDSRDVEAKVLSIFNTYVRHWKEHTRLSATSLQEAYLLSSQMGDVDYAGRIAVDHCGYLFCVGTPLEALHKKQTEYLEMMERSRLPVPLALGRVWNQMIANLRDAPGHLSRSARELFDDSRLPPKHLGRQESKLLFHTFFARLVVQYLLGDFTAAAASARMAETYAQVANGSLYQALHCFYHALALLAQYEVADAEGQVESLRIAGRLMEQLKNWASLAPMNFAHRLALVQAELARVTGANGAAVERFSDAILKARENGYLQDEALAYEREAIVYKSMGREDISNVLLRKAADCFRSWGALRKLADLEGQMQTVSRLLPLGLDTAAIVKASHMLSQEIRLDQLIEKLMNIAVENAGAEKGFLLLKQGERLAVQARYNIAEGRVESLQNLFAENCQEVALSVIHYVARTQQPVVLSEACHDRTFGSDTHVSRHRVLSLLCLPIACQGRLSGLLYLENNLGADIFTFERVELLKVLTTQMAISLENAGLYSDLEDKVAELRRSEQKFRAIFDQTFQLIGTLSVDGILLRANQTALQFVEAQENEVIGKPFWQMAWWAHDLELQQRLQAGIKEAAGGKFVRFEATHTREGGQVRAIDFSLKPIVDSQGTVIELIAEGRDITDRKRNEILNIRLNRELRAISKCNEILMRVTDEQVLLNEVCRIVCEEAGYCLAWAGYAERDGAKSMRPVAQAGHDEGYVAEMKITWAENERGSGPSGLAIRSGKSVYIQDIAADPRMAIWRDSALQRGYRSLIALPLKGEDAGVFGVLTIYSSALDAFVPDEIRLLEELAGDLSFGISVIRARIERNQAEESLALRSFALNKVREGAFLIDERARFLDVNEEACRSLGYTREELLGMQVQDIDPDFSAENWPDHWRNLKAQHSLRFEGRHRTKDGQILSVEIGANYLEYGDKSFNLALVRDITERKRAEEEQAKLRQHVQQLRKMEAIGQLAGGIAHDFNNILAVVNGYSELLLLDAKMEQEMRSRIQEILQAGNRGASLVRQLLAFSRTQVLQPKILDLNYVVEDMRKMLGRLIGEDIEMKFALDPALDPVLADPSQMEQIILNFCINARDAMPDGGSITIETANSTMDDVEARQHYPMEPGRYVQLSVSDTGVGMSPEIVSRIFEPFFTTKSPDRGTGLGLSTVYGIVKQSGGQISVHSEVGHGSTFVVYLPVAQKVPVTQQPVTSLPQSVRGTETILLVEDIAALRDLTREILVSKGYTVLAAGDGEQALQIGCQQGGQIALLLTDVALPKIKGPALAKSLQQQYPKMKVLYVSGYADDSLVQSGVLQSGTSFLQKPFSPDTLSRKVRELLDAA